MTDDEGGTQRGGEGAQRKEVSPPIVPVPSAALLRARAARRTCRDGTSPSGVRSGDGARLVLPLGMSSAEAEELRSFQAAAEAERLAEKMKAEEERSRVERLEQEQQRERERSLAAAEERSTALARLAESSSFGHGEDATRPIGLSEEEWRELQQQQRLLRAQALAEEEAAPSVEVAAPWPALASPAPAPARTRLFNKKGKKVACAASHSGPSG